MFSIPALDDLSSDRLCELTEAWFEAEGDIATDFAFLTRFITSSCR